VSDLDRRLQASQLLLTAGDNSDRVRSEASFAALCGVSPVPASSGKVERHRLNRGGDRAANSALHIIAIGRLRTDHRLLQAVQDTLKAAPELALADAGFRAEDVFKHLADHRAEIIVALGREGRDDVKIDPQKYPHTAAMADKLGTDRAKAAYRRRKAIVELPNGWIKHILGFRQFSFRGLSKVRAEWKLVCAALNVRRMGGLCAV
jgi:Transposase DDE domain/Transposase IS116/IS110/IS902 family